MTTIIEGEAEIEIDGGAVMAAAINNTEGSIQERITRMLAILAEAPPEYLDAVVADLMMMSDSIVPEDTDAAIIIGMLRMGAATAAMLAVIKTQIAILKNKEEVNTEDNTKIIIHSFTH